MKYQYRSYALVSVSDKRGIVELCRFLAEKGIGLLSTGGTAKMLTEAELPVIEVSDYTGFPEMMDGRLKTLHPKVHGGILGRNQDRDMMKVNEMVSIDYVIVNLYPFAATVARPGCTKEEAIENIDIGGPTMIRAAAKNHDRVCVICDPNDYPLLRVTWTPKESNTNLDLRAWLAHKAFAHTAAYDATIAAALFRFVEIPGL